MPTTTPIHIREVPVTGTTRHNVPAPRRRSAAPNRPGRVLVGIVIVFAVAGLAGRVLMAVFG